MSLSPYAELHCVSNFSFLRGASHPEELVERAKVLGYGALAITDECSLAGVVRAHRAALAAGLPLVIGAEFNLACGMKLVLLACNRAGYGNLSALITLARRRSEKGSYRLFRGDLEAIAPSGAVPDCLALWVPAEDASSEDGLWLARRFPKRCWIAVELHCGPDDEAKLADLQSLGRASGLPLVASGDVHMHVRSRRPLQDTLTALRLRTTVFAAGRQLFPNAERHLRSRLRLARLYPPELLEETVKVSARCVFSLQELRYEYPEEIVPPGQTLGTYLALEVSRGLQKRYPQGTPGEVAEQVKAELALIAELQYEAYFLTVYDIVRWAREECGILCQGRGSAANSTVCYALGITEVDPARSQLLFERFISKERGEPPDIDVDFEHQRREEVIQYIYSKYGRERAALAAAVITYRTKGALRDLGRALGFGRAQIDALTASLAWWDKKEQLPARFAEVGLDPEAPRVRKWLALSAALKGFPRHLTQHVGGFVISRGPLAQLVPVENAAMTERSVIQWDKDDLDAIGLMKVDILALGMLSAIRRMLALVAKQEGRTFQMQDIPADDGPTYALLSAADTVGVFQVESRAQMAMLPRLKPRSFYDLVVEVALVRPGPIQGDMVHPYLQRREAVLHQGKRVRYPSAAVEAVLGRTHGVPIFQEQAMQLAIVAAGFTPGEADQLRRAMGAWRRRGGVEVFRDRLIQGMAARGYAPEFAERLFHQIEGFGDYGFPESHAASFALLVYASAWLKCHYPAVFLCGLLNSQPMGFYAPAQLIQDARRHGVVVKPVSVTCSDWDSDVDAQGAVRLGLREIVGFSQASAERLASARRHGGFLHLADLASRAGLSRRDLDLLAAADALADLAGHRRQAAWAAAAVPQQGDLFSQLAPREAPVNLAAPSEAENLVADYGAMGLTLGRHPLALLRDHLAARRFLTARQLSEGAHRQLVRSAGIVTCRQRPGTATGIVFVTLEDETGLTNVVVHAALGERQRKELLGARLLGVFGQLQKEGRVVHLVAKRLVNLSAWLGQLQTVSRDFH